MHGPVLSLALLVGSLVSSSFLPTSSCRRGAFGIWLCAATRHVEDMSVLVTVTTRSILVIFDQDMLTHEHLTRSKFDVDRDMVAYLPTDNALLPP